MTGWLSGAILVREARRTARSRGSYRLRGAFLALLIGITLLIWLAAGRGDVPMSPREMSVLGRSLYVGFFLLEMVLALLTGPLLVCGALADEADDRTLEVLLTAPIRRFSLVVSKFTARMLFAGALLLAGTPVLIACTRFGGVSPTEVVVSSVMVGVLGCWAAALTMFASALVRKGYVAVLIAYFLLAGWTIGIFLVLILVSFLITNAAPNLTTTVGLLSPPFAFGLFLSGEIDLEFALPGALGLPIVTGVLALAGAAMLVGRPLRVSAPRESAAGGPAAPLPRVLSAVGWWVVLSAFAGLTLLAIGVLLPGEYWSGFAAAPLTFLVCLGGWSWALTDVAQSLLYHGRAYRAVWANPFAWKEIALSGSATARFAGPVLIGAAGFVGILCLPDAHMAVDENPPTVILCGLLTAMLVVVSVVGGASVTHEREAGLLDLLLVSPAHPRTILDAKLAGALAQCAPVAIFTLLYTGANGSSGALPATHGIVLALFIIAANLYFQGALACALSLWMRTSTGAIVAALAVPLAAYAGWPILVMVVGEGFGHESWFLALMWNPYFYVGATLADLPSREMGDFGPGFYPSLLLYLVGFVVTANVLRTWAATSFHRWSRLGVE